MQDHVDYRRAMALTRDALDVAATAIHGSRAAELDRWVAAHPRVRDYARFRAATERRATAWTAWPLAEREGRLRPDPPRERVHLLAQWLMDRQLTDVARTARRRGGGLQFDLPLGVNLAGYDVWRHREAFALEANAGAPPDSFFPGGQDWGFPPLHPERIRDQRYAYPIACIRTLARHASVLRIDHVMGLHRLFWVPRELGPDHGVYVRSRPDELSAILSLEAHRAGAVVLGEDLGTVPRYVRDAMDRRGLYRTFVLQEELRSDRRAAVRRPPSNSVASLNTHDMPTFASFWRSLDIDERRARGWLSPADAKREHARRATLHGALLAFLGARGLLHGAGRPRDEDVLRACLAYLASSESAVVTVSVEDLWLETRPQNVPGTTDEEPNWRRRLAKDLPTFRADAGVVGTLEMIDRLRKGGGG